VREATSSEKGSRACTEGDAVAAMTARLPAAMKVRVLVMMLIRSVRLVRAVA
jgi:hypothetical protein